MKRTALSASAQDWSAGLPTNLGKLVRKDGDMLLRCAASPQPSSRGGGGSRSGDSSDGTAAQYLLVHKQMLQWSSKPLQTALGMRLAQEQRSGLPMLPVDGTREQWVAVLPYLYPTYGKALALSADSAAAVLEIAHKYDMAPLLDMARTFVLNSTCRLAHVHASHWYVLRWIELAERLQLDELKDRCIQHLVGQSTPDRALSWSRRLRARDWQSVLKDKEGLMRLSQGTVVELLGATTAAWGTAEAVDDELGRSGELEDDLDPDVQVLDEVEAMLDDELSESEDEDESEEDLDLDEE